MAASPRLRLKDLKDGFTKYFPYCGLASYSMLALHSLKVYPEELIIGRHSRAFIFHGALALSGIGMGTYLFNRPVFRVIEPPSSKQFLWSAFGSWMFNFGSLLLWAICKETLPENKFLRAVLAVSSSAALIYVARDYLQAVDSLRFGIIAEREVGHEL